MNNWLGLGISYGFIAAVIGLASWLVSRRRIGANAGRKIIHVLVGHWWFLAMALIEHPWVATIGPASFIIINLLIIKLDLLPALSGNDGNLGTVYYPAALLVLVVLVWFAGLSPWIGAMGMMVMCWGDAAAAVVGQRWGHHSFALPGGRKSIEGTLVMAAVSFLVLLPIILQADPGIGLAALGGRALLIAIAAAIIELITPHGLDNITVPLGTAGLYWAIFL